MDKRDICLRALDAWLDDRSYFAASAEDFKTFLDTRSCGPNARYTWISHIHCFYAWAVDEKLTVSDPTAHMERPTIRREPPRPADGAELKTAMAKAEPLHRCWIMLGAFQGLRCQEIAGLRREHVLEAEGLLRVIYGSRGNGRLLPLHPETLETLLMLPMPPAGWIFRQPMGGKFSPTALSVAFNAALRELGVDATAHQLRHFFGSSLYSATGDLRVTQKMLGHVTPATTTTYLDFRRPVGDV
jgi:integrase